MRVAVAVVSLCVIAACGPSRKKIESSIRPATVERLELPIPHGSSEVSISPGKESLYASWLDPAPESGKTRLRFARFDGEKWDETRVVAEIGSAAASSGRSPMVKETTGGAIIGAWFDDTPAGRAAFAVLSSDGGVSWGQPIAYSPQVAAGTRPFVWADTDLFPPAIAWVGTYKTALQPEVDAVFLAAPDATGRTIEVTMLDFEINANADVTTAPSAGGMIAFRRFGAMNSWNEDESWILVATRQSDGVRVTAVDHDGAKIERSQRRIGPVIAADGKRVAVAHYTEVGGPTVRMFFSGSAGRGFGRTGAKFLCVAPVQDLRIGRRAPFWLASIEGEQLLVRRGNGVERVASGLTSARMLFAGTVGGREYVAWSAGSPRKLTLVRLAPAADSHEREE